MTDQAPELLREQVARIIAPNTWELMDEHCAKHGYIDEQKREVTHGNLAVIQSFLRADSVIALLTRPPSERPVAQVREALAEMLANHDGNSLVDSNGARIAEHDKEKYRKFADRILALTAERSEAVRENLTAEEFAQVLPRPEAAVALEAAKRMQCLNATLQLKTQCWSEIDTKEQQHWIALATVALAIQHEEPGRLTMTSVPRPSLPSPTKLCRHCGRPEIERGHEYTADGYCNGIG